MRKIHIDDEVWQYRIGSTNVVIISPNGKRINVRAWNVAGVSCDVFERGQYKKTNDGMVLPSHVKAYIEANCKG